MTENTIISTLYHTYKIGAIVFINFYICWLFFYREYIYITVSPFSIVFDFLRDK